MRLWPVALMTLAVATTAHAESDSGSAFRVGIGLSKVTLEADDFDFDDDATGFEVFGGWELNRYVAAEAGYMDGGEAKDANLEFDSHAIYASVLGSLWLNDYASLFARAGVLHWKSDVKNQLTGRSASLDGNDLYYGVGVSGLLDTALLRLEYRMGKLDDFDLSMINVNIAWRF